MFIQGRQLIQAALAGLSEEAYLMIPPGFDNNIAWNLGHIIVTQQALHYRLSGLPTVTTKEDIAMFRTGSSPADWSQEPHIDRLLLLLAEAPQQLKQDYETGLFAAFQPYTTSIGISMKTIEDALAFNNFHEGLHLGSILALRNFTDGG
jgi:hypothetical protein